MWDTIRQQSIYWQTYNSAFRSFGWDGSVVLLDGYKATCGIRYSHTVTLIRSGKIKQMKARLIWKFVEYYMSTKHI